MRRGLLLTAGATLILSGAGAMTYAGSSLWARGPDTAAAQERLATDLETAQTAAFDDPRIGPPTTDPFPEAAGADPALPPVTLIPGVLREWPPQPGEALGRIVIPTAGVDWMVVEGVALDYLRMGPGHMPGTAVPGQPGNAVISGHRTTYGAPFFRLGELVPGDEIAVQTLTGTHLYEVVETMVVLPTATWVTGDAPGAWLTLTTCHPPYRSIERLVVVARLTGGPNAAAIAATLSGDESPPRPPP